MKIFTVPILLTCISISVSAQQERKPISAYNHKTILTYGLRSIQQDQAERIIAPRWNIQFQTIAGCVITKDRSDSVDAHNKIVYKYLEKQYGKDWKKQFEAEIKAEKQRQYTVQNTVEQIRFINQRNIELKRNHNEFSYDMTPINRTDEYLVLVQAWHKQRNQWITYYKLKVNYKSKTYILLSDREEPAN